MSIRARLLASAIMAIPSGAYAQGEPARIALVVGEASYPGQPLATTANDAGLIASTLQQAGYDVVGARDLGRDAFRRAIDDFVAKAQASPPGSEAFVYFSGYGLQYDGADYVVPVDATLSNVDDVSNEAVAIGFMTRDLAATSLKSITVVMDASKRNNFPLVGPPIAGGLAIEHPDPRMTIAFDTAPGSVTPDWRGTYGPYAGALAETLREGGLAIPSIFRRVRIKVAYATKGDQIPWDWSQSMPDAPFLEASPNAASSDASFTEHESGPVSSGTSADGYAVALARDSLSDYDAFIAAFPGSPEARRVRALAAVRREAIAWRGVADVATPSAFQAYLSRYPSGPHVGDARRGLTGTGPRQDGEFSGSSFVLESPPGTDLTLVDGPSVSFDDPNLDLAPPPPQPAWEPFSYDPTAAYLTSAPIVSPGYFLPLPFLVALPAYVRHRDHERGDRHVPVPRGVPDGATRSVPGTGSSVGRASGDGKPVPTATRPADSPDVTRHIGTSAPDRRARESMPAISSERGSEHVAARPDKAVVPMAQSPLVAPRPPSEERTPRQAIREGTSHDDPMPRNPERQRPSRVVTEAPRAVERPAPVSAYAVPSRTVAPVENARPTYVTPTYAAPSPAYVPQPRQTYAPTVVQQPQVVQVPQSRTYETPVQSAPVQRQSFPPGQSVQQPQFQQPQAMERPVQQFTQPQFMQQGGAFRGRP